MVELNILIGTLNSLLVAYGPFILTLYLVAAAVFITVAALIFGIVIKGFIDFNREPKIRGRYGNH